MNKNKIALAIIAVTVIIAGCTDTTSDDSASTAGLQITNFSATPSTTYGGQSTQVLLTVRNNGGVDVDNSIARLYKAPIGSGSGSWSFESENAQQGEEIGTVRAADEENQIPAQERQHTWSLSAPELGSQSVDYNFQTRVYYDYSTEATTEIELVQEEEFLQGDYTPSRPSTTNTDGPVQIEVSTRSPIRYFEGDEDPDSDLCVTVRNEGDGTPFHPSVMENADINDDEDIELDFADDDGYDQRDQVRVTVPDSAGVDFGDEGEGEAQETISLTGSRGNHCFGMTLPNSDSFSITQTVPLSITAEYGYYTDSSTVVSVQPRN